MAKFEKIQEKINETLDSVRSTQKNALYVVLGVQKLGAEKISDLRERTQIDFDGLIKRGEEAEGELTDKFDEFKNSDNAVAKAMAKVESQVKDLNESTEERFKKISDKVSGVQGKVKDQVADVQDKVKDVQDKVKEQVESIKSRFSKDAKPAKPAKKVAPKKVAKKPAAKKAAAKKPAAKKAAAKKAA